MRGVIQGFLRSGFVRAGGEVDLDVFADVDAGDVGEAHVFEGFFDSDALGVNDGFFWGDDDFGFHAREVKFLRKLFTEASQKVLVNGLVVPIESFSSTSTDGFMKF